MSLDKATAPDATATRVALVSERRLVGEAVAAALRSRSLVPVVIGWPRRHDQARALGRRVGRAGIRVGLILCDLETPDRIYDVELLVGTGPVRWLVLTESVPGPRWGAVLEAGAVGILPATSIDGVAHAVRGAEAGRSPTPDPVRERVIRQWRDVSEEQRNLVRRMERLTPRETQILGMLYDGKPVRAIARYTETSEATVRSHVKAIRGKLAVDSQLAAVAMYRRALETLPRRER